MIGMSEHGLDGTECFNYDIFDACVQHSYIHSVPFFFSQILPEERKTPLVPDIILVRGFVELEVLIVLVNCVIRQMHVLVAQIGAEGWLVRFSRQTSQAFSVQEDAKWVTSGHQDIQSEIKLQSFY